MSRGLSRFTEGKKAKIQSHPYFEGWRSAVLARAKDYLATDPPRIKYSAMHSYYLTGHRSDYAVQAVYQERMQTFFNAYLITEDEGYLTSLADEIWNICSFECWTGPWHIEERESLDTRFTELDLSSTDLGANMAEIIYYVGDKLPELVTRRAKDQVYRRIIRSYADKKNEEIYWFYRNTNWSAVCTANVFTAYFYLASDDEIEAAIPRMLKSIECYLSGLDGEGCCIEGYGYWNYGFGHFCRFADLLRRYTDGRINLFENEKVRMIALFQQKIAMNDRECLSFSDCDRIYKPLTAISHLLKLEYDDVEIPPLSANLNPAVSLRDLTYQDPKLGDCTFKPKSHSFKNAQWFVYHGESYSLGAKAGHNNETHNHNDVGSFMVSKGGKITLCDLGSGEYTKDYFSAKRYEIMVCSSRGHSVPIINGGYQITTDSKAEILENSDTAFKFRYGKVYSDESIKNMERGFECLQDKIILTDSFEFNTCPESLVERFVSDLEMKLEPGRVTVGNTILEFDPDIFDAQIKSEEFSLGPNQSATAYFADLSVKIPSQNMIFKFVIR